jgi:hypothetical protein
VGDLVDVQLPAVLRVPEVPDVEAGQNLKKDFIRKIFIFTLKILVGTKNGAWEFLFQFQWDGSP